MRFRGRKVWLTGAGYPEVYLPEHPASSSNGKVLVHRVVAYEKYGELPEGHVVHHKDGDPWNWSPENLELMLREIHRRTHASTFPAMRKCEYCGKPKTVKTTKRQQAESFHCSLSCANLARQGNDWPSVETVQAMVEEVGFSQTGRNLGVSDNAVRKFLKRNTPS